VVRIRSTTGLARILYINTFCYQSNWKSISNKVKSIKMSKNEEIIRREQLKSSEEIDCLIKKADRQLGFSRNPECGMVETKGYL
jgi:hypothetical protein